MYVDYCWRAEGSDVVCTILVLEVLTAGLARLMARGSMKNSVVHLFRQVPSLTGAVEVDDEETHASLEGADQIAQAQAQFVCHIHQHFHGCVPYLVVLYLTAEIGTELCLFPTHEPSLPVRPLGLVTPAPFVSAIIRPTRPPYVDDGVPHQSYWVRSGMNLVLCVLRFQGEAGIVVVIPEANWSSNWENVDFHYFDNELTCWHVMAIWVGLEEGMLNQTFNVRQLYG